MEKIKIKVYAKINLSLDITGLRADGYHELDMLNTSVDIFDTITAQKSDNGVVFMDGAKVSEGNTAVKALHLVEKNFGIKMKVEIKKGIPFSAGLGGSSADASGVFYCAHRLYGIPLAEFMPYALKVGCDVPYMMYGGGAIVRGIGETLIARTLPKTWLVVCQKDFGASTKEIYGRYDEIGAYDKVGEHFNALEKAAVSLNPRIAIAKQKLLDFTDEAFMSGSGSAYVGVFDSFEKAKACFDSLDGCVFKAAVCTLDRGIDVLAENKE